MGWTIDPEPQGVLLHYSEDPYIVRFAPHTPKSNPAVSPAVWAIDAARASLYWFPRDCPRVAVWANTAQDQRALSALFDTTATRLHGAWAEWENAVTSCDLYEYRFDAVAFEPWTEAEGQWISRETVVPLSVEPLGDLVAKHRQSAIELRFTSDLAAMRTRVVDSGLPFSIVRWREP